MVQNHVPDSFKLWQCFLDTRLCGLGNDLPKKLLFFRLFLNGIFGKLLWASFLVEPLSLLVVAVVLALGFQERFWQREPQW